MRRRLPEVLQQRDYSLLLAASICTALASQMMAVAIGWQVYAIHRDPLDLGLIGLLEFAPLPVLALPAGQLADRVSRKAVFLGALLLDLAIAVGLLLVTRSGANELWPFLLLALALGTVGAVGNPAVRSLPPSLVPVGMLATATAVRTTAGQGAVIVGPAIGGALFAIRAELVFVVAAGLFVAALGCAVALRVPRLLGEVAPGLQSVLGGIRFLRRSPVVLGAILLDLFAVLFGGAIALLPLFARDVLHVGPAGLGLLRSTPAVGALVAGLLLTRRPLGGRAGRTLLIVVGVFGASMVVFGLSRSFALSAVALAVAGFADMISVNIRSTTVALATPAHLLGRVNAVEMVFISASNELGAFESGVAAALVGAVPAVVAGGILTVGIALAWPKLFPGLTRVDRLEQLRPDPLPYAPTGRS